MQNIEHNTGFTRKTPIFRRKLFKIAGNNDLNITLIPVLIIQRKRQRESDRMAGLSDISKLGNLGALATW
jgi:hypothetical protein